MTDDGKEKTERSDSTLHHFRLRRIRYSRVRCSNYLTPFLEEFNHRSEDLNKGLTTVDEFLGFLTDWFVGHTIYKDQKLFEAI